MRVSEKTGQEAAVEGETMENGFKGTGLALPPNH